jgi:uncharacterized membrane protein YhaH (DUF805 family)
MPLLASRARRRAWWLVAVLLPLVVFAVGRALAAPLQPIASPFAVLMWLLVLPQARVTLARLHDRGVPGWWGLALIAPTLLFGLVLQLAPGGPEAPAIFQHLLVGLSILGLPALLALVVICGLLPGTRGLNRFGPDPRAR